MAQTNLPSMNPEQPTASAALRNTKIPQCPTRPTCNQDWLSSRPFQWRIWDDNRFVYLRDGVDATWTDLAMLMQGLLRDQRNK